MSAQRQSPWAKLAREAIERAMYRPPSNAPYQLEGVVGRLPNGRRGVAVVDEIDIELGQAVEYNASITPAQRVVPGKYKRLMVEGKVMMSDSHHERETCAVMVAESLKRPSARVMIAGLGLGMILPPLLEAASVAEIVVVEKYDDVIKLVAPAFRSEKLRIVHGDIFDLDPGFVAEWRKFDVIWFDIWPTITTKNLDEMEKLHAMYAPRLADGGWMDSWMRPLLEEARREEPRLIAEFEKLARWRLAHGVSNLSKERVFAIIEELKTGEGMIFDICRQLGVEPAEKLRQEKKLFAQMRKQKST